MEAAGTVLKVPSSSFGTLQEAWPVEGSPGSLHGNKKSSFGTLQKAKGKATRPRHGLEGTILEQAAGRVLQVLRSGSPRSLASGLEGAIQQFRNPTRSLASGRQPKSLAIRRL